MVGNAVLGYEPNGSRALNAEESRPREAKGELHRRSHSVPLEAALLAPTAEPFSEEPSPSAVSPAAVPEPFVPRRNSVGVPVPIRPKPLAAQGAWTAERDGETQAASKTRRYQRRETHATEESSSVEDAQPFQFAKKEVGEDGQTRLVVIHTSDRNTRPAPAAAAGVGMHHFEWAKGAAN